MIRRSEGAFLYLAMSDRANARHTHGLLRRARHYPQRGNDARAHANKYATYRMAFPMTRE